MAQVEAQGKYSAAELTLGLPRRLPLAALATSTLALFSAAELLTTQGRPVEGMVLHGLVLSTLILAASLTTEGDRPGTISRFLYSLTLVPLIRILSLSMPLNRFDQVYWYLVVGLPVFLAALVVVRALGLARGDLGLRFSLSPWQPAVALLGFALGLIEYQILEPDPLIEELTPARFLLSALILLVFTGFLEELIFRGILQATAMKVLGGPAILYVSLVFAILHIGYRSVTDVVFVLGIALLYGWVVRRTGSIMGVSMSHGITNITLFLVVPFLPVLSARPGGLTLP